MARLFIVSTPIGNLDDITYRAVETLRSVKRVLAEDTRRAAILFKRCGIETPRYSAHAHNEEARVKQLLRWLDAGEDVALISDAGTPLLSDPGLHLVRAALEAGHEVVPIPGPSALLAALVASGLDTDRFTFYGFVPRSGRERKRVLEAAAASSMTSVFHEAPGRLRRLLEDLEALCGGERRLVVARELTKLHEDIFRGTLEEALTYYGEDPVRGEVVVVLSGVQGLEERGAEPEALAGAARMLRSLLAEGWQPSAAAREIARRTALSRRAAYNLAMREAGRPSGEE